MNTGGHGMGIAYLYNKDLEEKVCYNKCNKHVSKGGDCSGLNKNGKLSCSSWYDQHTVFIFICLVITQAFFIVSVSIMRGPGNTTVDLWDVLMVSPFLVGLVGGLIVLINESFKSISYWFRNRSIRKTT